MLKARWRLLPIPVLSSLTHPYLQKTKVWGLGNPDPSADKEHQGEDGDFSLEFEGGFKHKFKHNLTPLEL